MLLDNSIGNTFRNIIFIIICFLNLFNFYAKLLIFKHIITLQLLTYYVIKILLILIKYCIDRIV